MIFMLKIPGILTNRRNCQKKCGVDKSSYVQFRNKRCIIITEAFQYPTRFGPSEAKFGRPLFLRFLQLFQ